MRHVTACRRNRPRAKFLESYILEELAQCFVPGIIYIIIYICFVPGIIYIIIYIYDNQPKILFLVLYILLYIYDNVKTDHSPSIALNKLRLVVSHRTRTKILLVLLVTSTLLQMVNCDVMHTCFSSYHEAKINLPTKTQNYPSL